MFQWNQISREHLFHINAIYLICQFAMASIEYFAKNIADDHRTDRTCVGDDLSRFLDKRQKTTWFQNAG
jgi:hypothetical protein